jgi:hypothetical protein
MQTLSDVHAYLHDWDRIFLKGPRKRFNTIKAELEELSRGPMSDEALGKQQEILNMIENFF